MSVPRGPRDTRSARIPAAQDADAKDDNGTPTASLHLLTQSFPASPPPGILPKSGQRHTVWPPGCGGEGDGYVGGSHAAFVRQRLRPVTL